MPTLGPKARACRPCSIIMPGKVVQIRPSTASSTICLNQRAERECRAWGASRCTHPSLKHPPILPNSRLLRRFCPRLSTQYPARHTCSYPPPAPQQCQSEGDAATSHKPWGPCSVSPGPCCWSSVVSHTKGERIEQWTFLSPSPDFSSYQPMANVSSVPQLPRLFWNTAF